MNEKGTKSPLNTSCTDSKKSTTQRQPKNFPLYVHFIHHLLWALQLDPKFSELRRLK